MWASYYNEKVLLTNSILPFGVDNDKTLGNKKSSKKLLKIKNEKEKEINKSNKFN